ncbi:MAG: hypothetical protein IJW04_00920 [Ruminococcus sp.]|nr:hypothetical protein [Ruminococcus sp.]
MANMAVLIPTPKDNNPITLLLMRKGKNAVIEPPAGYGFIADENNRLLRDERGAYLIENKED